MSLKGKEMDTSSSETSVFYQMIPAVGDDGKNMMKLIPVQRINGHFVRSQIGIDNMNSEPEKKISLNIAQLPVQMASTSNLIATAPQQIVRSPTHACVNVSSNQAVATMNFSNFVSKNPLPHQPMNQMTKVPQTLPFSKSVRSPDKLPVSVKSTALSRREYIPRQNLNSPTNSPATTLGSHISPLTDSGCHSLKLINAAKNKPTCDPTTPKRPKPHLKLIQKLSQRPNSPVKWVIEEESSSHHQSFDSLNLPTFPSEILQTVAKRENKNVCYRTITKQTAVYQAIPAKSGVEQGNSFVMCNEKIFFIAKKCNLPFRMRQELEMSPLKNSKKFKELKEVSIPSNEHQMKASASIPQASDEVIDLCDDDPYEELLQTATMSSLDEDNVIFVSYIPPKSKSDSSEDLANPSAEEESTQMTSSNSVTDEKNKATADTDKNSTKIQSISAVAINGHKDYKQSMDHGSKCNETEMETLSMEISTNPTPYLTCTPKLISDHALRQAFGIMADVKICLQRIQVKPAKTSERRSVNSHVQKGIHRFEGREDTFSDLDMHMDDKPDQISPCLHKELSHNECSHNKLNTDAHMTINERSIGQSSCIGILGHTEEDPGICYMEPLDEDLLCTDLKDIPKPQTYTNLNTKLSRLRRTRKRTMCPCCPSPLDPTVKSKAKQEGPPKQEWKT